MNYITVSSKKYIEWITSKKLSEFIKNIQVDFDKSKTTLSDILNLNKRPICFTVKFNTRVKVKVKSPTKTSVKLINNGDYFTFSNKCEYEIFDVSFLTHKFIDKWSMK